MRRARPAPIKLDRSTFLNIVIINLRYFIDVIIKIKLNQCGASKQPQYFVPIFGFPEIRCLISILSDCKSSNNLYPTFEIDLIKVFQKDGLCEIRSALCFTLGSEVLQCSMHLPWLTSCSAHWRQKVSIFSPFLFF